MERTKQEGQVIIGVDSKPTARGPRRLDQNALVRVMTLLGLMFTAAALVDVAVGYVGADLRVASNRFMTASTAAASLPSLVVGLALFTAAAFLAGSAWRMWVAGALNALVVVGIIATALIVVANRAETFAAAPEAMQRSLTDHVMRFWAFIGLFGVAVAYGAVITLRSVARAGQVDVVAAQTE